MAKKQPKPPRGQKRSRVRNKRSPKRGARKRQSRARTQVLSQALAQAKDSERRSKRNLIQGADYATQMRSILDKSLREMLLIAQRLIPSVHHYSKQLVEAFRPLIESPFFPILQKMSRSKGVLRNVEGSDRIIFIPEAILTYGFAHLPSESDPKGRQFEQLPATPSIGHRNFGAYLFLHQRSPEKRSHLRPEQDPAFLEAQQIYRESDKKGIAPHHLLRVLLMESGIERFWVELDPCEDLDAQVARFKRWFGRAQRALYGRAGKKPYPRSEAPRDTLIYTLKESAGLRIRAIVERIFQEVLSPQSLESLELRVSQSLWSTRTALRQAGLSPPARTHT